MNILIVNNDTDSLDALLAMCSYADNTITHIHHSELHDYDVTLFELIVLSGGWWYDDPVELLEKYAAEIELIRNSPVPILGICIGMLLMHVACEQAVPLLDEPQSGFKEITVTPDGQNEFGLPEKVSVFKNHTRGIVEADPAFEVLGYSPGHIEIMRHRVRPLLGVQFHPELEPTLDAAAKAFSAYSSAVLRQAVGR